MDLVITENKQLAASSCNASQLLHIFYDMNLMILMEVDWL